MDHIKMSKKQFSLTLLLFIPLFALGTSAPVELKEREEKSSRKKTDNEISAIVEKFVARLAEKGQPVSASHIARAILEIRGCQAAAPLFQAMDNNDIPRIRELVVPVREGGRYSKACLHDSYLATLKYYQLEGEDLKEFLIQLHKLFDSKSNQGTWSTEKGCIRYGLGSTDTSSIYGFTPLMRAVARGDTDQAKICLPYWRFCGENGGVLASMVDQEARINARAVAAIIYRYVIQEPVIYGIDVPLADAIQDRGIGSLFDDMHIQPMSLAARAGNIEMFDLLDVEPIVHTRLIKRFDCIIGALTSLIVYSELALTKCAEPIFKAMGIINPKPKNYGVIGRKLMQNLLTLFKNPESMTREFECAVRDAGYYYSGRMGILAHSLRFGSSEMLNIVASNMAHIPHNDREKNNLSFLALGIVSGEKLGMLFFIDADKDSPVFMLRNSLLERIRDNSTLLMRLQRYMKEAVDDQQNIPELQNRLNRHLIPVLSSIVTDYFRFDYAIVRQILAMGPKNDDQSTNYMLGKHLTQIITEHEF